MDGRKKARKHEPIAVWGASMAMAPNSAKVGRGSWVAESVLMVVSMFG